MPAVGSLSEHLPISDALKPGPAGTRPKSLRRLGCGPADLATACAGACNCAPELLEPEAGHAPDPTAVAGN